MLAVTDLSTGYGESQILFDVSLHVAQSTVTGLVGSNAAGKSTLINAISGVNSAWCGTIEFLGTDITKTSPQKRVEMGLIQCPEGRRLFPTISVYENILLGAYSKRARSKKEQNMKRVLEMFPILAERRSQAAGLMSGGEQQMCALARALMADPALLILDEPSLGLAPIIVSQVFEIIRNILHEGVTIFLVEQNVKQALGMSSTAYVMESGKITMSGAGRELLANDELSKAYLGI
jgi:ABC-type branched-chain amino acid transport systems, ATPase component